MQAKLPQLWLFDLRPLMQNSRWRMLLPEIPPERQRRALACRREADAARLVGAGYLLRQALLSLGIPASRQIFRENEWGKPYLVSSDVEFSLTHAGHFSACALDASPVGVDLEAPRMTWQVAGRCFHPEELSFVQALPAPEQPDALLRVWTAKEAYTKQLGKGLIVPLNSFCVDLAGSCPVLRKDGSVLPERLHEYRLEDMRLCLCSFSERPEITQFIPKL